jgi:dienelactone hydrolase
MAITFGRSTCSCVLALPTAVSAACAAYAGSITTHDPPVATLADGRTGTIAFEASPAADVAGALAALRLLATHPSIDPSRIGVIGFSRGGSAAINSALEPIRHAIINEDLRFAAHVALYPGCAVPFVSRISTARRC